MIQTNPADFFLGDDRALANTFLVSSAGRSLVAYLAQSRGPIVGGEITMEPAALRAARAQGHEDCVKLMLDLITPGDKPMHQSDYPDATSDLRRILDFMADDNTDITTLETDGPIDLTPVDGLASMEAAFEAAQTAPGARKPEDVPDEELPARERDSHGKFKGRKPTDDAENTEAKPAAESDAADPTKEAAKPADEKKPEDPQEDEDDAADREALKGVHPKKAKVVFEKLKSLKTERKTLQAQLAERDAALVEAKKVVPMDDEERKELKRLQDYEFITDPEKSGKITREFDDKLKVANNGVYPILSGIGVPATKAQAEEQSLAIAKANGKEPQPMLSIEELKEAGGIKSKPFSWWETYVLKNEAIDGRTRGKIGKLVNEYFDTAEAREQALAQAPKDREAWTKQQQDAQKEEGAKYTAALRENVDKVKDSLGEWAKDKIVPPNATPEQKAQIEAHNKTLNEKYVPAFLANLDFSTPEKHAKVAMGVGSPVALHYQAKAEAAEKRAEAAEKRAKEAEEKYSGVKQSGRISTARNNASPKAVTNFMKLSPEETFDLAQEAGLASRR